MATSQTRDFASNNPFNSTSSENYNANPPANDSSDNNPSATGPTGSTNSSGPVTGSYGNTHSSTGRTNPIHPSDSQSTAHPAYGNSKFSSPYETGGGNPGQGDGEGAGVGRQGGGEGAGVGESLGQGGHGGLGRDYHQSVDAAYGHATSANPPAGYGQEEGKAGPYDTAGGNSAQTGSNQNSTHMGGQTQPASQPTKLPSTTAPSSASGMNPTANTYTGSTTDNRSTGSKVKEVAHGVKGLFAAVHGAGESIRGELNANVDRQFHETSGEERNTALAQEGKQEMQTGMFSDRTKEREGVVPGDNEMRQNRAL